MIAGQDRRLEHGRAARRERALAALAWLAVWSMGCGRVVTLQVDGGVSEARAGPHDAAVSDAGRDHSSDRGSVEGSPRRAKRDTRCARHAASLRRRIR